MNWNWRRIIIVTIRTTVVFNFTGLLVFWGYRAVEKYLDQPTATHTEYTLGDDGVFIRYPDVTFCSKESSTNLTDCIKNLDFECSYVTNYIEQFRERFTLNFGHEHDVSDFDIIHTNITDFMFDGVPCLNFDLSRFQAQVNDSIGYVSFFLNITTNYTVRLHTNNLDFREACSKQFCKDIRPNVGYEITLKKWHDNRESTRKSPCGHWSKDTCIDIKLHQKIAENYNCKTPSWFSGQYLNQFIGGYAFLPTCNETMIDEDLWNLVYQARYLNYFDECEHAALCNQTKFSVHVKETSGGSWLDLTFGNMEVEHYITYISYDTLSLISEVGGVLGMFLGISGISIGFSFASIIERCLYRRLESSKSLKGIMKKWKWKVTRRQNRKRRRLETAKIIISTLFDEVKKNQLKSTRIEL